MSEEDRSDTESPMGPVENQEEEEPLHGYVNVPPEDMHVDRDQQETSEQDEFPPLLGKKERSRYVIKN